MAPVPWEVDMSVSFGFGPEDGESFNISNANARILLTLLGFDGAPLMIFDGYTPEDILERIGRARQTLQGGHRAEFGRTSTLHLPELVEGGGIQDAGSMGLSP